jgi:hypothetical protein
LTLGKISFDGVRGAGEGEPEREMGTLYPQGS